MKIEDIKNLKTKEQVLLLVGDYLSGHYDNSGPSPEAVELLEKISKAKSSLEIQKAVSESFGDYGKRS